MSDQITRRDWLMNIGGAMVTVGIPLGQSASSSSPEGTTGTLNPWRLQKSDLRDYMHLGVQHIYGSALNRLRECLPYVRFNLTKEPTWARHEYWGSPHMVGRFLDALAVTSPILGLPPDAEAVGGLERLLHGCLDHSSGLAFDTLPDPGGRRSAAMHHSREVLLGLVGLNTWQGSQASLQLARRFVRTLNSVTQETGSFPSDKFSDRGWIKSPVRKLNQTSGRLIGALVKYFRVTGDPLAVEMANRFADQNIKECFTEEGELTSVAGSHLHSTEGTMTSLIDLGLLTGNSSYVELGWRLYDVGLRRWRTSWGWAKENRNIKPGRGEANNTGDFIEAALLLGQHRQPKYFDDAERMIRNGLLAAQVVSTDWIPQSDLVDTKDYAYTMIRKRAKGAFAFTLPNSYHSYNTDLMGGALQSLAQAYRAILTKKEDAVYVNLLFDIDTPWFQCRSEVPRAGRLVLESLIRIKVFVRLPTWVVRSAVKVKVAGVAQKARWQKEYLALGDLPKGTQVQIKFDQPKRRTEEYAPGFADPFNIEWLGDTIVAMTPRPTTSVPLY